MLETGGSVERQRGRLRRNEAFDLLDAAIRELPGIEQVQSARDSLQLKAKVTRPRTYGEHPLRRWNPLL